MGEIKGVDVKMTMIVAIKVDNRHIDNSDKFKVVKVGEGVGGQDRAYRYNDSNKKVDGINNNEGRGNNKIVELLIKSIGVLMTNLTKTTKSLRPTQSWCQSLYN